MNRILNATENRFKEFNSNENVLSHLTWHVDTWPVFTNTKPSDDEQKRISDFQTEDVASLIDHVSTPLLAASGGFSKQRALKQFKDLKLSTAVSAALQKMDPDAKISPEVTEGNQKKKSTLHALWDDLNVSDDNSDLDDILISM